MNLVEYAKMELAAAGLDKPDADYGGMVATAVLELVAAFAKQGHSGFSAPLVLSVFSKVARYEPLVPLTGADDEWIEHGEAGGRLMFQNKRCSHVFKDSRDGEAYDNEGRVFREPGGVCFVSSQSRVPVTFPYMPKREYVDVPEGSR